MHVKIAVAFSLVAAFAASPASAAAVRTFVSGKGSDSNPCSITAPCRSLQQAVSQTALAGEIVVLDPAGYGTVSISQSISIVNDGVGTASITVPSNGTGIAISASGGSVHIRGLEIDGMNGSNNNGIIVSSAASVEIENCVLRHLQNGINTSNNSNSIAMEVQHSTIGDNVYGLVVGGTAATVNVDFVQMPENSVGVYVGANDTVSSVNVRRTFISGPGASQNDSYGVYINAGRVFLSDSEITNNSIGVDAARANAVAGIDRSTITANSTGVVNDGTIFSYKNNAINYNLSQDIAGSITTFSPE